MNNLNQFVFGIYPYIAISIFLITSLIRFEREQYSWRCESSQVLYTGNLRLANNLFHIGIIGLLFGHAVGLLTPVVVWDTLGISHGQKQLIAMIMGGILGLMCLTGLLMLLYRRLTSARLAAITTWADKLVLIWLIITVLLGLSTIVISSKHLDGEEMLKFMSWAQYIVTARSGAADFLIGTSLIFRIHIFMGISLFVLFPFTKLVHAWSGFGSVFYLVRNVQIVRRKNLK